MHYLFESLFHRILKKKKSSWPVSRVLYCSFLQRLSFICVYRCRQTIAVYPPARASNPQTPVYMTLQLPERTAQDVTIPTGGLLLHLLTLTMQFHQFLVGDSLEKLGGYFLLHDSTFADSFPLGSRMLYVARTFLFCLMAPATDRPTAFMMQSYK